MPRFQVRVERKMVTTEYAIVSPVWAPDAVIAQAMAVEIAKDDDENDQVISWYTTDTQGAVGESYVGKMATEE